MIPTAKDIIRLPSQADFWQQDAVEIKGKIFDMLALFLFHHGGIYGIMISGN